LKPGLETRNSRIASKPVERFHIQSAAEMLREKRDGLFRH
jgi:hypothetical protein